MGEHDASVDGLAVRVMEPSEYTVMRDLSVTAFGDDPQIGLLLDLLHESWAWPDELSFVAIRDDELVGHVLFSRAILDAPDRLVDVLVMAPVGVHPDFQNHGVGSRMISEALNRLADRQEPLIFVEGHPGYYTRFGFQRGSELGFTSPSPRIPDPAFMVYPLTGYEPSMTGRLVYPDAFWRADSVGLRD